MAVYDCFTFFNELDILEVRLEEMAAAVDVFVLAEATTTFQGKAKPLFFDENRARYARFADKISHVVVERWPSEEPWDRERFQRDALRRGLGGADPQSTVLISDVDEILRPAAIEACVARAAFSFFELDMFLYFMNWHAGRWVKSYGAPMAVIEGMPSLSAPRETEPLRYLADSGLAAANIVEQAGWHFSWLGGVDRMIAKLEAFAHTESSVQRWREPALLSREIASRRFFNDGAVLSEVAVDRSFPRFVRDRRRDFERLGLLRATGRFRTRPLASLVRKRLGLDRR